MNPPDTKESPPMMPRKFAGPCPSTGPHMGQVWRDPEGTLRLTYTLFCLNGISDTPRPAKPDSHQPVTSNTLFLKYEDARAYAMGLFRGCGTTRKDLL